MKRVLTGMIMLMFMLSLPVLAMASNCCPTKKPAGEQVAMSHGEHGSTMDHAKDAAHDMHKGHEMAKEKMQHGDMEHADQGKHMGHEMAKEKMDNAGHDMHKGHDHGSHADKSDSGHAGGFATIGEKTHKGVTGTAKLMTYDEEKAKLINATHHIMVYFTDEAGKEVTGGKVALKIKGGDADSKPMMLMQMGSGFGADLRLDKGHYDLEVGTRLEDGQKRKFEYMLMNH